MTNQTRDTATTRTKLLDAGRDVFAADGFAGARTQAIADRAGINKALIQYHFGGKQALYSAVLVREIRRGRERLRSRLGEGGTATERLGRLIDGYGALFAEQPQLGFLLTREQMNGAHNLEPEVLGELLGFFETTRQILADGVASGELREVDPHETHLSLVGGLVYFLLTVPARAKYTRDGVFPLSDPAAASYTKHIREVFLRGLRANPDDGQ